MKQQAIDVLDTLEKELDIKKFNESSLYGVKIDCAQHYIREAKSRIQALQNKVPTITIPEWTVLIGKDEYESLKEKAWRYDDLNK